MSRSADTLRTVNSIEDLLPYLENELEWPLQAYELDELTFEYQPIELGLNDKDAAAIRRILQLRPLEDAQPWGVFFVEFEKKKLPVVVLRRILSHLVVKQRASANSAERARWQAEDLLFVSAFGDEEQNQREIAFAHFHQEEGDLPTLRVLGWDGNDTPLKLEHVAATLKDRLRWPTDPEDHETWRKQWRGGFRHRIGQQIKTADKLAVELAALARGIRTRCITMLAAENEQGPLRQLYKAFQTALIHDLKEEDFADTYAQTITYGLLTAAISRTEMSEGSQGTALVAENMTDMVPITNPFLKEMLQTFLKVGGRRGGIDFDELGIQDVVELLRGKDTNLPAILRDFGNKTRNEDPVIHFYEHFLAAYNKKLKVQRGVFYTPQPVVSYIVRSVHELLQTEFGLEGGLASTITWGEMAQRHADLKIPSGTDPNSHFVVILDPATGTATFLVEVIDLIYKTLRTQWQGEGLREPQIRERWNDYVPSHLLPRLYGYELMMAPYAIAHMKIGLKLFETGYRFGSEERVRIYLTNALEPAQELQKRFESMFPALAHEAQAVNAVKRNQRFTVIVGNPPYSNFGQLNRISFILNLLEDYKRDLNERKINIDDDFIKFIRYSQHLIEAAQVGVLGFITNNTYLDGLTHRQMRKTLIQCFPKLYICNLHGSLMRNEVSPDGSIDENVFDIKQGVTSSIFCRPVKTCEPNILYSDIWGTRLEKYNFLLENGLLQKKLVRVTLEYPNLFFIPKHFAFVSEYDLLMPISKVFRSFVSGIQTGRDSFVSSENPLSFEQKLADFRDERISDAQLAQKYELPDFRGFDLPTFRELLRKAKGKEANFVNYWLYRPFDIRPIIYHSTAIKRMRGDIMTSLLRPNIALITVRQLANSGFSHVFITRNIGDGNAISINTREYNYYFPLHVYSEHAQGALDFFSTLNLNDDLLSTISRLIVDHSQTESLPLFTIHYIYSILNSPTYRTRYAEFLKIDFPRIPLTSSLDLFRNLATLGGELVALHLVEAPLLTGISAQYEASSRTWRYSYVQPAPVQLSFVGSAQPVVEKVSWSNNTVWLDKAQSVGFVSVPEAVWKFHIGGYQVCEKWLKDRKGRTLNADDLTHYHRIVVSLHETIRLMTEIDQVIEQHGGWPIQ